MNTQKILEYKASGFIKSPNQPGNGCHTTHYPFLGKHAAQIRLTAEWVGVVAGRILSLGNTHGGFLTNQVWR